MYNVIKEVSAYAGVQSREDTLMKRILLICVMLLCLALSAVLFASCSVTSEGNGDQTTAAPHEHVWDAGTVTKTGSCNAQTKEETEKGEIMYTCTVCGATKTEETSGHTWDEGDRKSVV